MQNPYFSTHSISKQYKNEDVVCSINEQGEANKIIYFLSQLKTCL